MKPGETKSYSQKVSVRYVDDLEDEEYSGKLKTDYTYLGAFRVSVPAGTFDAILLRTRSTARLVRPIPVGRATVFLHRGSA